MANITFKAGWEKKVKPGNRLTEYFADNFSPGFPGSLGLRVRPTGKMTWFIAYRARGKSNRKRLNIGTYPELSFSEAKRLATSKLEAIDKGLDPTQARRERREAPTMNDLWDAFVEKRNNAAKRKAPKTISEEDRRWYTVIKPAMMDGKVKVTDVTPGLLDELLTNVARSAPVSANRLHSFLGILFKPALARGWIKVHPLQWIDKPGGQEHSRKRVLEDNEIKAIWPWLTKEVGNSGDILKLGLYTAQRPGEIMAMKWTDIDLENGIWHNTENKTSINHLVPLPEQVVTIIADREQRGDYVFFSAYNRTRKTSTDRYHTKSTKDARRRIQAKSGVSGWTAHDLRRTARTIMSRLNIEPHIRELVLGHSQGKIQDTYDRYDYLPEKRRALQKLANEIDRIIGLKHESGATIIKLRVTA